MPYKSTKQRAFFHTNTARKAGITPAMTAEYDKASKGKKLPQRVKKANMDDLLYKATIAKQLFPRTAESLTSRFGQPGAIDAFAEKIKDLSSKNPNTTKLLKSTVLKEMKKHASATEENMSTKTSALNTSQLGKNAEAMIQSIADAKTAAGIGYAQHVAVNFIKQASGSELTEAEVEKVANSLLTPVVLTGLAKIAWLMMSGLEKSAISAKTVEDVAERAMKKMDYGGAYGHFNKNYGAALAAEAEHPGRFIVQNAASKRMRMLDQLMFDSEIGLGKNAEAMIQSIADAKTAAGIGYAQHVAVEFIKQASGVELSNDDIEKVANSLLTPVVLAGLAKIAAGHYRK